MAVERMNAALLRHLYPRVLAKTLQLARCLPDAEDAVQDAIERALVTWPRDGEPEVPEAWLVTVATNCHRDRMRHTQRVDRHRDTVAILAELSPSGRIAVGDPTIARGWNDELLALVFACCHPALDEGESAALAFATVIGLSTTEIAAAFVVAPRTMEQRLTRARQRLRERGDPERTTPEQSLDRLDAVLRTLYLLFNEGYWSTTDTIPIRSDLCRLALGLARSLQVTYPGAAEVTGLLCTMQLHDARRAARLDACGEPVPLPEQDRGRWNAVAIAEAEAMLERALGAGAAGPFLIEAAISALHSRAASADATDWNQIAELYALLEPLRRTPAVRVNRAFAISQARDPATALALLDRRDHIDVAAYPYTHLVRGVLLAELDRIEEAKTELRRAERVARNAHEKRQIRNRIEQLENRSS
jgi:RNA polymerase sigma-70 factor, ECF subfamily